MQYAYCAVIQYLNIGDDDIHDNLLCISVQVYSIVDIIVEYRGSLRRRTRLLRSCWRCLVLESFNEPTRADQSGPTLITHHLNNQSVD